MKNRQFSLIVLSFSCLLYYLIGYQTIRDNFWQLISLYSLLFVGFFYAASFGRNTLSEKEHIAFGLLFRAILIFSMPALSDDFYRFVWDGRLSTIGQNPFAELPVNINKVDLLVVDPDHSLFSLLNSPVYYSIYPPLLQFAFWVSAVISPNNLLGSVVVMKVFLFAAEAGTLFAFPKLLEKLKLDKRLVALYALCPLPIVEFIGNIHFEAFMVFFLIVALLFLAQNKWLSSSAFFGLAVAAKLLPLMFLPFFIRRLGLKKSMLYGIIVIAINVLLFLPFYHNWLLRNFVMSLSLYFNNFEFNGSIYQIIRWVGFQLYDFNAIRIVGPFLPWAVIMAIAIFSIKETKPRIATLPKMMLLALSVYFALATTVNPWYAAAFIPLGILSGYRWPLLWAALLPLSYHTYRNGGVDEKWWLVTLEYIPVYLCALYEFGVLDNWKRRFALGKATIKLDRLKSLYSTNDTILEIGCGNGALNKLILKNGYVIAAVDIENKSVFEEIKPLLYDGNKLPIANKQFDVAQMITMLHHTNEPEKVIQEAMRVSNRLIIMEDIYSNTLQKYITWFTDSLVNWEFSSHPHSNKTDQEWQELFNALGLELQKTQYYPGFLLFFSQVTYSLKVK